MKISNKQESVETIKKLRLNYFPEKTFTRLGGSEPIKKFLNEFPAEYYSIRCKSTGGGWRFISLSQMRFLIK